MQTFTTYVYVHITLPVVFINIQIPAYINFYVPLNLCTKLHVQIDDNKLCSE